MVPRPDGARLTSQLLRLTGNDAYVYCIAIIYNLRHFHEEWKGGNGSNCTNRK